MHALAWHRYVDRLDEPELTASVTKLSLFLYCFAIRRQSSQVQVLWEDHRYAEASRLLELTRAESE